MARTQNEKAVQREVTRFLSALGFDVDDMSQPRATMQAEGIPDLYAVHAGLSLRLWVECKSATGRLRPAQAAWHERERAAGGTVLVARSAADLVAPLKALGAPIR